MRISSSFDDGPRRSPERRLIIDDHHADPLGWYVRHPFLLTRKSRIGQAAGAEESSPGVQQRVVPPLSWSPGIRLPVVGWHRAAELSRTVVHTAAASPVSWACRRPDPSGNRVRIASRCRSWSRSEASARPGPGRRRFGGQHRELIWIDGAGLLQQGGFDLSDQLRVLIDHPVG